MSVFDPNRRVFDVCSVGRNILQVAGLLADSIMVIILDFFSEYERSCGCNLRRAKWWWWLVVVVEAVMAMVVAAVFVVVTVLSSRKNIIQTWSCGNEMLIVPDLSSLLLGIHR